MSLEFYRWLHITAVVLVLLSLAALWGLTSSGTVPANKRKSMGILHGLGITFVLVSGFGLLARLGLTQGLPAWIYIKLIIWLLLGGSVVLAKRKSHWGVPLLLFWLALVSLGAYLGVNWSKWSPAPLV